MPDDLNFQKCSTVQSNEQPLPVTMAMAATIAPSTFLTFLTGTVPVATITPPVTGSCMLAFVATTAATTVVTLTTGNIIIASTFVPSKVLYMTYDPSSAKWYPSY